MELLQANLIIMAEEKIEESAPGPFYAGSDKFDLRGEVVGHDKEGLLKWIGNQEVVRNEKKEAVTLGGKEIGRNGATRRIESIDGKPLDWKDAEKLQRFLDGQ